MKGSTLLQFLCNTIFIVGISLEWTTIAAASSAPVHKYARVHLSKKSDHHLSRYIRRANNADDGTESEEEVVVDDGTVTESNDDRAYFEDDNYGRTSNYQFDGRKSFYDYQTDFTDAVNNNLPEGYSITDDEALEIFAFICCATIVLFACFVSMCCTKHKTEKDSDPFNLKYRLMLEKDFRVIV